MKKEEIKGFNGKGEEVTVFLKHPSSQDYQQAKIYSNKTAAIIAQQKDENGKLAFLTRNKVKEILTQTGEWNVQLEEELIQNAREITELERKLAKGGIKLSEGRESAIKIRVLRNRQIEILSKTRAMDEYTLEAQVENANFDHLLFSCLLDEEGEKMFNSVEDYRERGVDPVIVSAASRLAAILYDYDSNKDFNLPENKFLLKYKFVDEKLRLVNKEGHLVDERNRTIDEQGRLVNENGEFVDAQGRKITEEGEPVEEFVEFIED